MNTQKNIFINSGIRHKINHELLQSKSVTALGHAIGYLLAEDFETSCPILIATDTRPSGQLIKKALIKGLTDFGHDVYDAGICPTPFVAKALKDYQPEEDEDLQDDQDDESFFTLGIVITASHNNAEYNGIKILTPFGYADIEMEEEITHVFNTFLHDSQSVQDSLPDESGVILDFDLNGWYQSEILNTIQHNFNNLSIVLDTAHGATAQIAPSIFTSLGFKITAINNSLDGLKINQNSGCTNSELLLQAIENNKTEWACAFDGDGDRVIIAHKSGIIFDGDDIAMIISEHPSYRNTNIIVGTVMTNQGLQNYFATKHKKLIRTQVGERNIIAELIKHQAFLGTETCGHVTLMDHAFCSDGIFAALMFFESLTINPTLFQNLYEKYKQQHATIPLDQVSLNKTAIQNLVTLLEKTHHCRIIVRPSNTEPILRIMVEHTNNNQALNIMLDLKNQLLQNKI